MSATRQAPTTEQTTEETVIANPYIPRKLLRARRRIGVALAIIEDGHFDLLTPNNLVDILTKALGDFVEFEDEARQTRGLNWDALPFAS